MGNSPAAMCKSVRHTPQALTRRSTWPGLTCGLGISPMIRGRFSIACGTSRMAAFMDFLSERQLLASAFVQCLHCLPQGLTTLEEVPPRVGTREVLLEIA